MLFQVYFPQVACLELFPLYVILFQVYLTKLFVLVVVMMVVVDTDELFHAYFFYVST